MANQDNTVEERIARVATAQKGIVTWKELRRAGVSGSEIHHRLRIGLLICEHRGVYRVGHAAPNAEAGYLAAVKACGEGAALGGLAGAYVYGLVKCDPPPPEVACPTQRSRPGIRTQRRRLHRLDRTTFKGIPILTVPAVLVDIAPRLEPRDLARACHEAGVRYGIRPSHVQAVLVRRPNAPRAGELRAVMTGETPVTLSRLEDAFRALLVRERLPLPVMNRLVDTKRVDCRWLKERVTAELDSYRFHNTRHAWEQDLRREREAHARGDAFRRYGPGDVFDDPGYMLTDLRSLLLR